MTDINKALLREGNRRMLAKAITLLESSREEDREAAQDLLESMLPYAGRSVRLGISGTPGVGKSTFIEAFGKQLIAIGKKIAVLAVDPSSPLAGGSILGDKTRMPELAREPQAYIRPSPASGELGGVAQKTRESMLMCEAAGFDIILVETVGVGQSEHEVANMVDFFLVLLQPNAGDELQGIKRGIMELADAVVINKADGAGAVPAEQSKRHYENALSMLSHPGFWSPQVLTCSALKNQNIDAVWQMLQNYVEQARSCGAFAQKRAEQNRKWMDQLLKELIEQKLKASREIRELHETLREQVVCGETTPYLAAKKLAGKI